MGQTRVSDQENQNSIAKEENEVFLSGVAEDLHGKRSDMIGEERKQWGTRKEDGKCRDGE